MWSFQWKRKKINLQFKPILHISAHTPTSVKAGVLNLLMIPDPQWIVQYGQFNHYCPLSSLVWSKFPHLVIYLGLIHSYSDLIRQWINNVYSLLKKDLNWCFKHSIIKNECVVNIYQNAISFTLTTIYHGIRIPNELKVNLLTLVISSQVVMQT